MLKNIKTLIKLLFRACGLDVRRSLPFEPYAWLKDMNIKTILDVGANTGQFASEFHGLFPEAKLYSFEPLEDCYNKLLEKMRHISEFHAFNFALGDENAETQIFRNDFTPSSSLLPIEKLHEEAFEFTKHTTAQRIKVKRLDDIINELDVVENILIKIDVQGTEDKVIMGGKKLLSKASVLIVETSFQILYQNQPLFNTIYSLLREMGFVYKGSENPLRNPRDGSILQCDSVFLRDTKKEIPSR
jgi:FkbM family methyltransferase